MYRLIFRKGRNKNLSVEDFVKMEKDGTLSKFVEKLKSSVLRHVGTNQYYQNAYSELLSLIEHMQKDPLLYYTRSEAAH